jgi:hypothetical protein
MEEYHGRAGGRLDAAPRAATTTATIQRTRPFYTRAVQAQSADLDAALRLLRPEHPGITYRGAALGQERKRTGVFSVDFDLNRSLGPDAAGLRHGTGTIFMYTPTARCSPIPR